MNDLRDIEQLKTEIKALRTEIKDLKEFVRALYSMIDDGEEEEYLCGDFPGGVEVGRYNT
ncbi:MAG: hypothetical protein GXX87_04830 [Euryarchaeota archaeon]|jgi:hypothetical protein|nr:hypothetical protein [Euryarchaeota archaeon]